MHRDGSPPESRSYYHRGILIEVEHIEESRILAPRMRPRWPVTSGGDRGRIVLHEKERWTDRLEAALDARDGGDPVPAQRLALIDLLEYRDKLRNARLTGDEIILRWCGSYVADSAANLVLFLNRRAMVTTRWFFRQALECPEQPPHFREHLEILLGVRWAAAETFAAASEDLTNELIQFAATRGIDVESEELLV